MYNYKQGYFRLIAPSKFIARSKFRQTMPKLVVFLCKIIKWGGGVTHFEIRKGKEYM